MFYVVFGVFMAKIYYLFPAMIGLIVASTVQASGNPEQGKKKSQSCVVCHGPNGIASSPGFPHIAGQPVIYLAEQLQHYRNGKRQNPVMNVIAKSLTDQDIQDLAAWYSSNEIQLKQ